MLAAPAPLAGVIYAMNAAAPGDLLLGQLVVAVGVVLVAGSGWLAERLVPVESRLLTPLLQIAALLLVWTLHAMLAGSPDAS